MKTSINLGPGKAIVIEPGKDGSIRLALTLYGAEMAAGNVTLDQAEVMSMGLLHAAQAVTAAPLKFPAVPAR